LIKGHRVYRAFLSKEYIKENKGKMLLSFQLSFPHSLCFHSVVRNNTLLPAEGEEEGGEEEDTTVNYHISL
jgi:hypothetical protein